MSITATLFALTAAVSVLSSERYDDCVALVETDIDRGRAAAQQWADEGGGANAQHCLALADMPSSARRGLSRSHNAKTPAMISFARAFFHRRPMHGLKLAKRIWRKRQSTPHLNWRRAPYAAQEKWLQVVAAVRSATQAGFVSADTYVHSARAHIALGDYVAAADDVVDALTLAPTNIDALVLRGEIQQTGLAIDVYFDAPPEKEAPGK